jgi:hypothetical protein
MTEQEWLACTEPQPMLDFLRGKASDRKLRLFAVACCRTVWELLPDEPARRAVQVAELMAEGRADPMERQRLLQEIGPRVNTRYGIFLCGGSEGTGSIYAAMAATATLNPDLTFTWYMGNTPSETHTAWECVARAKAQTAKEEARERRWQERAEIGTDGDDEPDETWYEQTADAGYNAWDKEHATASVGHCVLLRDMLSNPFRPVVFGPARFTETVKHLAQTIYDERAFDRLPILADALEEAGCTDADILAHCRSEGPHFRGCWAVDLVLGKK